MSHNSNLRADFDQAVERVGRSWSGAIVREIPARANRVT
jgi:hypothetical protein